MKGGSSNIMVEFAGYCHTGVIGSVNEDSYPMCSDSAMLFSRVGEYGL